MTLSSIDIVLQACLEDMEARGRTIDECLRQHADKAEDLAPLLNLAARYRGAPAVRPSSAFRATAQSRLLNSIASHQRTTGEQRRFWASWRLSPALLPTAAALLLVLAALGTTTVMANEALPDSPLFPAKLVLEQARLQVAWDYSDRVRLHLAIAERRAQELAAVSQRSPATDTEPELSRYEAAVRSALDEAGSGRENPEVWIEVDRHLAEQERLLSSAMAHVGPEENEQRASLGQALGFLAREREEVRRRAGGWRDRSGDAAGPTPAPAGNLGGRGQEGATATAAAAPSEPPNKATVNGRPQGAPGPAPTPARNRWGQEQTPGPVVSATPTCAAPSVNEATATPARLQAQPSPAPDANRRLSTPTPLGNQGPATIPQQQGQPTEPAWQPTASTAPVETATSEATASVTQGQPQATPASAPEENSGSGSSSGGAAGPDAGRNQDGAGGSTGGGSDSIADSGAANSPGTDSGTTSQTGSLGSGTETGPNDPTGPGPSTNSGGAGPSSSGNPGAR